MRCQGRAEGQAANRELGFRVLNPAELAADPGELVSQVLVGLPQLPAERHGPLAVVGGHEAWSLSLRASMPDAARHQHTTLIHSTTVRRDPESERTNVSLITLFTRALGERIVVSVVRTASPGRSNRRPRRGVFQVRSIGH
jgi:hypothetical protein